MKALSLLLLSSAALAQAPKQPAAPPALSGYDCLIEPNQRIEIRSPANALIDKVLVERGSQVRAGDTLVLLDGSVEREALAGAQQRAESEAELRVARARADYAREKFRRREDLREQNYITAQDRDEAQAELRVAEAELALAVDNRRLAGIEAQRLNAVMRQRALRAPFNGEVATRTIDPGAFVRPGNSLVSVVDRTTVRITAVPERAPAAYTVLGWKVDDLDATIDRLVSRGVTFLRFDGMEQDDRGAWTAPGGDRIAWFADPDGNTLSLQAPA